MTDFFNTVKSLERAKAHDPEAFKLAQKQHRHEERILPRSLRRAYRSKDRKRIEREIANAMFMGFSKKDIRKDYFRWRRKRFFVVSKPRP